jgi:hypothetical protein
MDDSFSKVMGRLQERSGEISGIRSQELHTHHKVGIAELGGVFSTVARFDGRVCEVLHLNPNPKLI